MEEERNKPLYFEAASMPAAGAWAHRRRLAAALREIIDSLISSDASEEELAAATHEAAALAARLRAQPSGSRHAGYAETSVSGNSGAFFDQSPLIGLSNPLSPPMSLEVVGDRIAGRVVFGAAYEGPPGHVHGGFVAAAFDEVLGFAQTLTGNPGMTAGLTIRYRRPTPLRAELRFDAGVDRVEGRKIFTSGALRDGDTVTAEAQGVFVSVDAERFQQLLRGAAGRVGAG
ncbi:MAG TPA: PaaI family thioesterase [Candidatus Binatia bacterium]|jgi:acyl-coenzyme A thioesterase PaaI-like protein